jgi:hypothetical protein
MAGLLGQGWEDPQSQANMALAAGLLQGNMGAGLLGANQVYAQAPANAMKLKMAQAQMDNYASEIEARKLKTIQDQRQQKMMESFFPGMFGSQGASGAAPGTATLGGPAAPGQAVPGGVPGQVPAQGGNDIMALSQRLGIPPQAIQADIVFNGGKKISELLDKHGSPDWQVTNGYRWNKNDGGGAGFMPFLNTSQSGQTSMGRIGPDGLPVVSAPQGAMETYAGYQNVQEGTKANYDVMPVTPAGQAPQLTTRGALATNPQVQGRVVPPAQQAAADRERHAILGQEVAKAQAQLNEALSRGDQSAVARAQTDLASLNREMGGRRPSIGMPLQSPEEALRAQKGVEADSARNVALAGEAQKSKDTLANISQARELLKAGPTSSGIGSVVDSALALGGASTKGADVAAQLDTLSGWMVNNVPRMEGPQSNFDVQNYKTMAGLVGDRTKPLSQRLAALDTLEGLQKKYAHLNSGGNQVNTGGATGDFDQPKPKGNVLNELPKNAPKGQRVRDTQTGKVLQFNGLSWVEVK